MERKITLPIVHLNGTSARDLTEGYWHAAVAVSDALAAIGKIEFNARDYYPVEGLWDAALKERGAQVLALHNGRGERPGPKDA